MSLLLCKLFLNIFSSLIINFFLKLFINYYVLHQNVSTNNLSHLFYNMILDLSLIFFLNSQK
jgi:hypothetical protein